MILATPREDPTPQRAGNAATSLGAQRLRLTPLLVIGGLGALAFAVENAHQTWSALYLRDSSAPVRRSRRSGRRCSPGSWP
jgi:hypothetical protein